MPTPSSLFSDARRFRAAFVLTAVCLALAALCASRALPTRGRAETRRAAEAGRPAPRPLEDYGKLPMRFEANRGQTGGEVKFLARGAGYTLFLSDAGAALRLRHDAPKSDDKPDALARSNKPDALARLSEPSTPRDESATLRVRLEGSNHRPKVSGVEEMQGRSNYLIGRDPRRWQTGVPVYAKVLYESVYPGVDMVYYGREGRLEYDFRIAPGADARRIGLRFDGARSTRVEENGDLLIKTNGGDVRQRKPLAYQDASGARREVAARYVKDKRGAVRIELGDYDSALPLVIDPVLVYSSYVGGIGSDNGLAVAVDSAGSAYVAGYTLSAASGPAGATLGAGGGADAFVVKLAPDGKSFAYATYIGGDSLDYATSVAVDSAGNAYVAGYTYSNIFPVTGGAPQTNIAGTYDGFVAKLNATGSGLTYSTYLGGNGGDVIYEVAVNGAGAAYVAGRTDSISLSGFPSTTRAGSPAFKSTDAGASWSASASGLTASTVFDFAVSPTSPDTAYAATNLGVYKTTDGGANWQLTGQPNNISTPGYSTCVAVDPTNPSTVYVGTPGGVGLHKTTDGGATYAAKNNGLFVPVVNSIAVDPSNTQTVYAATVFGVFKTTNGGDNWTQANGGGLSSQPNVYRIIVAPSNPQTLYAATNLGVFKTTNGAGTWTAVNNGLTTGGFPPATRSLAISPSNPSTLYAYVEGFNVGVYKTTDGGANWASATGGLVGETFIIGVNVLLVDPTNPSIVYAGTSGSGVYRTTDGGANWAASNTGMANGFVYGLGARAAAPSAVYAGVAVGGDAFAAKLNASGTQFDYVRVFGGLDNDEANGLAVGADGSAYVSGTTGSADFPTSNAFQPSLKGSSDAFVAKLGPTGTTLYSTFLGGSSDDQSSALALGADGSAYVTGTTFSPDFPLANALQPTRGDSFPGSEAFVTKLAPDGHSLTYSTYLGGDGNDQGFDIAVGADGSAYVTGSTDSSTFPTQSPSNSQGGSNDAFVTRINPAGSALLFSTYFGGSFDDQGNGIAVDAGGQIYVAGTAASTDLPVTNSADPTQGGSNDAFVAKFGEEADLSVTISDSRDPVMIGNPLSYTLRVTNGGPSTATGVTLTDTLPAGLSFVSAAPTQGSCGASGQVVTCNLGDLADEGTASVTLNVNPSAVGTLASSAHVSAAQPDHNASNNDATQTTKISASPSVSGRVTGAGGGGLSGVTLTLSGSQSSTTQTDAEGFYQFAELPAGGDYTVTPSKAGVSFEPPSRGFNGLGADQTADFVGTECTWTLTPARASFGAAGGTGTVTVTTLHGCPWTAASSADWLTITSGASGTDTGTVAFNVAPTTRPRSARLNIAGRSFAVYQEFGSCGAPGFSAASYSVFTFPSLVRAADLNGDGRPDLVAGIAGGTSGGGLQSTVLLNDGAGRFTSKNFEIGLGVPLDFDLADFNGDGRPDLVISSFALSSVRVFFNDGAGGFGQSFKDVQVSVGELHTTGGVRAADFNRDGKADLVVDASGPRLLLGDGAGNFTPAGLVVAGKTDAWVEVGDVNADGAPDLIFSGGSTNNGHVAVALNDGAAHFGVPDDSPLDGTFNFAGVGDFDGDGRADLAVMATVEDPASTPSNTILFSAVVILAGDGAGHFTQKSSTEASRNGASRFVIADFNNDAKLDVAFGALATRVFLGDGGGGVAQVIQTDPAVGVSAAADFDGDSRPDLAGVSPNGVTVLKDNCAAAPHISGRILEGGGRGLGGATVTLSGAQPATAVTDEGGNYFFGGLDAGASYVVTPSKENYDFAPQSLPVNNLSGGQTADFFATARTVRLAKNSFLVDENINTSVSLDVVRGGNTSGAASVNYSTGGTNATAPASERTDYTRAAGTLHFAPGETTKTITVFLNDDTLVEGFEGFTVNLSSPTGAIIVSPSTALVEIRDNDFAPSSSNPVDGSTFFVRQHYHDFLNREPDAPGLAFWTNEIEKCGSDAQCREVRRVNVSAAFFLSIEFQETGYLVERTYKAAFGDAASPGVAGTVPAIRLDEFLPDTQRIGQGLVVGQGAWQAQLEANKVAYFQEFVTRARFVNAANVNITPAQFADGLFTNAGVTPAAAERQAAIEEFGGAADTADTAARARVLRRVAEHPALNQLEKNRAFVLMEYFGYLRRNPSDAPEATLNYAGWKFWLDKLEEFNGNFVAAEMVKAFITSDEYRHRFGQ